MKGGDNSITHRERFDKFYPGCFLDSNIPLERLVSSDSPEMSLRPAAGYGTVFDGKS